METTFFFDIKIVSGFRDTINDISIFISIYRIYYHILAYYLLGKQHLSSLSKCKVWVQCQPSTDVACHLCCQKKKKKKNTTANFSNDVQEYYSVKSSATAQHWQSLIFHINTFKFYFETTFFLYSITQEKHKIITIKLILPSVWPRL